MQYYFQHVSLSNGSTHISLFPNISGTWIAVL